MEGNASTEDSVSSRSSLETTIGLYWLHRIGIISLVLGMSFLLMYSFQYFGPVLKLSCGGLVAIAMLLVGRKLANTADHWFGYGLTAGGWSLAYFAVYAAYFLPAVKVIPWLPLESVLLIAVAAGSLVSALRSRSELMAIYSITLATGSILLSGPSLLSDVSFFVIACTASVLGNSQRWRRLFAFGLACCYVGHLYCASSVVSISQSETASAFLAAIWLVFTIGLGYSVHNSDHERKFVTAMSIVNALALVAGLVFFSGQGIPETVQLLLASAGAVYLSASRWLSKRGEQQLMIVNSLTGLSLINLAKVMHFSGMNLLIVDIIEIALLGAIGAKFGVRTFRWFAVGLAELLFPLLTFGVAENYTQGIFFHAESYAHLAIYAAFALTGLAVLHIRQKTPELPTMYKYFYYLAANLMWFIVAMLMVEPTIQFAFLVLMTLTNHIVGMTLHRRFYSVAGSVIAVFAALPLIGDSVWQRTCIATVVVMLYAGHAICRLFTHERNNRIASRLQPIYAHAANLLLTAFVFRLVSHDYVSAALGIEGMVLLLVGFTLGDAIFRLTGLSLLTILMGKLLFVDFAKFNTLERIISFIAAGVVFLLSSYAYTRFGVARNDESEEPQDPEPMRLEFAPEDTEPEAQMI